MSRKYFIFQESWNGTHPAPFTDSDYLIIKINGGIQKGTGLIPPPFAPLLAFARKQLGGGVIKEKLC